MCVLDLSRIVFAEKYCQLNTKSWMYGTKHFLNSVKFSIHTISVPMNTINLKYVKCMCTPYKLVFILSK